MKLLHDVLHSERNRFLNKGSKTLNRLLFLRALIIPIVLLATLHPIQNNSKALAAESTTESIVSVIGETPQIITQTVTKAYPGIEYNVRLGVIGGMYPYVFELDSAPTGMRISANGTITWTPSPDLTGQSFAVAVRVTDKMNRSVTQNFTLNVTTSGFYFIAPGGDDTTGTGAIGSPWATINKGLNSGVTGDTVYVRGGTYVQKWIFVKGKANRIIAYPGESPVADFDFQPGPGVTDSDTYVDGFEIRNICFKAFQVSGDIDRLVFRRNHMHHLYDTSVSENPSFIFFWDDNPRQYTNIVMQENIFHDLYDRASGQHGDTSANYHGGSTVWYNVGWSLYEDNEAYNIDSRGISDKDDGYKNTIRNNVFHDCQIGIGLFNQNTQAFIEVNHNLIYNCSNAGIVLGGQPGYLKDVSVHHNTIIGNIDFSGIVDGEESTNFNIFNNILGNGTIKPYSINPMRVDDTGGGYHYEYPTWFQTLDPKVRIDNNLVWANSNSVAGYDWGITSTNWSGWQAHHFDLNGIIANPGLDVNYALDPSSPYYGIYGRDGAMSIDIQAPTVPTNLIGIAASQTVINLTWMASTDNVGVAGYRIFRDGNQIGTSTTTSYSNSGLNPSTTYAYRIAAYDAMGNMSTQCPAISVTTPSVPVNHAPVLALIGAKSVNEGTNLNFNISATDQDAGTTLTYTATKSPTGSLPTGANFNAATRNFSWTPDFTQSGSYIIRFAVSDGALTDYEDVLIIVNNINQAPVLNPIGNKTGKTGTPISFTINATDPDAGTTLSYTITNYPTGANFNAATRTFTWTPTANQVGIYSNIIFQVSDGNLTDDETITITVSDGTPPVAPTGLVASTQSASQINLSWNTATDNAGVAGYRIYRNASPVGTTTNLNYTDNGLLPGTSYSYTVAAYDGAGNTSGMSNTATAVTSSGISLSSTNEHFSANAGKGRIEVYASIGFTWTVSNAPSWITVTSGTSGIGNGVIEYTVLQNTGARRTGTFTVNGITVTVTQQTDKNSSGVGLYNPANQQFILWNSTTGSPTTQTFSPTGNGWIPLSGDWDGNGTVTLGLYDPQAQTFHLRNAQSGSADLNFSYGTAGVAFIPVVGDWDGDGKDSVGLYNPATRTFRLTNTSGTGASDAITIQFGGAESTWIPVAGDWDGDGIDTVGLYSPEDGAFFLKNSHVGEWADVVFIYGPAGGQWLPVVGDWDGDQATGVGLYDPTNKMFFLRDSVTSGAADISFPYNAAGTNWIPVSGDWDGE